MTLRDLSNKDVIQLKTGENLGRIDDIVFDERGARLQSVILRKPEPEIFTTLMQTCRLAYDESIFVDDNKANAQAAYNLGITGILYKNPKSFTRALGACGIEIE